MKASVGQCLYEKADLSIKTRKRYYLTDWLEVNNLDLTAVEKILSNYILPYEEPSQYSCLPKNSENLLAEDVWRLAAMSMIKRYPEKEDFIQFVRDDAITYFFSGKSSVKNNCTRPSRVCRAVEVYCNFNGSAIDYVTIAHEFSHALHYTLLNSRFLPPVYREVCAFIGELTLLEYLKSEDLLLYQAVLSAWSDLNCQYLKKDMDVLKNGD